MADNQVKTKAKTPPEAKNSSDSKSKSKSKSKSDPSPKSGSTPEPTDKDSVKNSSEKPKSYSIGERQKPVTNSYRTSWDRIFGKGRK